MKQREAQNARRRPRREQKLLRENLRVARQLLGEALSCRAAKSLTTLSEEFNLSLSKGELQFIKSVWYVTNAGLLSVARRKKCSGINVEEVANLSNPIGCRYVFKATVHSSKNCAGFVGYGDADPSNVSPMLRGAELRIAETRAVNRALRKAYGIGLCSVEELGSTAQAVESSNEPPKLVAGPSGGSGSNGRTIRDHLCQVIRQHQLDPNLVKAYAVDFCGVKTLKDATRGQVETFVRELSGWAEKDRNALLCQLNGYLGNKEGVA